MSAKHLKVKVSCTVMSDSLQFHGLQPVQLFCPWNSPGKSTGVGCHFLLQRIFLTRGWNPGLLHCRQILYQLSHWSGLPFPSPEDLPDPGMEPGSPALQADSLPTEPLGKPLV